MKKKNFNLYISEHEDDAELIKHVQHDLEQMEQVFPVFTPDLNWFEQNIELTKKTSRKKLVRDLAFFWLIALSVVIISFMLVHRTPFTYFVAQACILFTFIISYVFLHRRKQVKRQ